MTEVEGDHTFGNVLSGDHHPESPVGDAAVTLQPDHHVSARREDIMQRGLVVVGGKDIVGYVHPVIEIDKVAGPASFKLKRSSVYSNICVRVQLLVSSHRKVLNVHSNPLALGSSETPKAVVAILIVVMGIIRGHDGDSLIVVCQVDNLPDATFTAIQ